MVSEQVQNERIEFLWYQADAHRPGTDANRVALGEIFLELRDLYGDRNSGGRRLTSGHGTFEAEIRKRGYSPRSVREWIADRQAAVRGEPSSTAKRRARRRLVSSALDPLIEFARLLPFKAAERAYKEAARILHPDHGGNTRKMQQLNDAWHRAKVYYESHSN